MSLDCFIVLEEEDDCIRIWWLLTPCCRYWKESLLPFLAEAGVSSGEGDAMTPVERNVAWLHECLELNGGRIMQFFGNVSLAMGVGTVFLWFRRR